MNHHLVEVEEGNAMFKAWNKMFHRIGRSGYDLIHAVVGWYGGGLEVKY